MTNKTSGCPACSGPPFSSLDLILDVITSDSPVVGMKERIWSVDDRQEGQQSWAPFFIRMYCSEPFIPDDRKLLCCQDAAAEIEGRSNISIFQFESHWNELVKNEKKGKNEKESAGKQRGANKDTIFFLPRIHPPHFSIFLFFFSLLQQKVFT